MLVIGLRSADRFTKVETITSNQTKVSTAEKDTRGSTSGKMLGRVLGSKTKNNKALHTNQMETQVKP